MGGFVRSDDVRAVRLRWGTSIAVLVLCTIAITVVGMKRPGIVPSNRDPQQRADALARMHRLLDQRVHTGRLSRSDGHVYMIDAAQLLLYAALRNDIAIYEQIHSIARRALITRPVQGGSPHLFVVWRFKRDEDPSRFTASGTTEALELARALWLGADRFGRDHDRETALKLLDGYIRHQNTDAGVWIIRNYYNLQDDTFADNSYLVDYDADFLTQVARETGRGDLCRVARKTQTLITNATTPAGLLHVAITPGLLTLLPFAFHSPNNLESLANVTAVAERSVGTNRDLANRIFEFALQRTPGLRLYFDAQTGRMRSPEFAGVATHATLVRLAIKLDRQYAVDRFLDPLLRQVDTAMANPREAQIYLLGQALLTLELIRQQQIGNTLPAVFRAPTEGCVAD